MCGFLIRTTFFEVVMLTLKNNVFWGSSSPVEALEWSLHSQKYTAWVAISKSGINGPFWFQDEEGKSVTVTTVNGT